MSSIFCNAGNLKVACAAYLDARNKRIADEREKAIQEIMTKRKKWDWKRCWPRLMTREEAEDRMDHSLDCGISPMRWITNRGRKWALLAEGLLRVSAGVKPETHIQVDVEMFDMLIDYFPKEAQ